MSSPAALIKQYLIARGIGTNPEKIPAGAWPVYSGNLPDGDDAVDNAIGIFNTAGKKDGREMRAGTTVRHPGIMIHVRSDNDETAYAKAYAVAAALDAILRTTVVIGSESVMIQSVSQRGDILNVGVIPGSRVRYLYSVNAIVSFA